MQPVPQAEDSKPLYIIISWFRSNDAEAKIAWAAEGDMYPLPHSRVEVINLCQILSLKRAIYRIWEV